MITFIENVSALSDQDLLSYSVKLANHENDVGLRIIACLREAERRMLYSQLKMSSLWEYATQFLGLSNGNAQLKIDAMRLSRDNPIAQEKIKTGELSLMNAAKVNSFLRQEKKAGNVYTPEQKAEVIESVLGLSQSQCERALLSRNPEAIPAEKVRPLTETQTELKIVIDEKTMAVFERLKELLSNKMPNATYAQLFDYLAREKVEMLEKKLMGTTLEKLNQSSSTSVGGAELQIISTLHRDLDKSNVTTPASGVKIHPDTTPPTGVKDQNKIEIKLPLGKYTNQPHRVTPRKYIPIEDQRWVMRRAKGQCEHITSDGQRCKSRRQLQVDHIIALACGGANHRENYRAICRSCNVYFAKIQLGHEIMKKFVPSLQG